MKRILVFLWLKVAEIGGTFAAFALLSYTHFVISLTAFGAKMQPVIEDTDLFQIGLGFWMNGAMGVLALTLLLMALVVLAIVAGGLYLLISQNWKWAERITDK